MRDVAVDVHPADDGRAGRAIAVELAQVQGLGAVDVLAGREERVEVTQRLVTVDGAGVGRDLVELREALLRRLRQSGVVADRHDPDALLQNRAPDRLHALDALLLGAREHLGVAGREDQVRLRGPLQQPGLEVVLPFLAGADAQRVLVLDLVAGPGAAALELGRHGDELLVGHPHQGGQERAGVGVAQQRHVRQ
ncbi:hypothetical protein GL325_07495 [Aeromicrobium sp. 636]|nr:hypothetical protein [Aeromicrobium sp. 636]